MSIRFSLVTPAYQRAHTLPRLYASLLQQDTSLFEWIVVDDGSTDGTEALVRSWQSEAPFPISVIVQPNGGKPSAYAAGLARASAELTAVLDSDDWLAPDAIAALWRIWTAIPEEHRQTYTGVTVLAGDETGRLLGTRFPAPVHDASFPQMLAQGGIVGDKWGFHRTEVLRAFPFPTFPGERFIPEGVVWNRITRVYRMRFVNEMLLFKEYQPDGLMSRITDIRLQSPRGANLFYREHLSDPLPFAYRFRTAAAAARYGIVAGMSLRDSIGGWHGDPVRVAGALAGWLVHHGARFRRGGSLACAA